MRTTRPGQIEWCRIKRKKEGEGGSMRKKEKNEEERRDEEKRKDVETAANRERKARG